MQLRPYQQQAIDAIHNEWISVKSTLLVLPTGAGKTVVFVKLAEDLIRQRKKILILAHREELINQASDKLRKATGLGCAIEKAEETAEGSFFPITVGSVQTLSSAKRLKRFKSDHYDVIIIDEAHHSPSKTYQNIINYFSEAKLLGVTATPDRGDKKNLGKVFETLAFEYTLPEAIRSGYLCPIKAMTIPLNINLTGVKSLAGDYSASDLDCALTPYLTAIAKEMKEHCSDRKTVVFLPLIATSQKMTSILNSLGFRATEINGTSQDRQEKLQDFHDGKYNVICNSMLLTEGWDEPAVDCIVCLRPTKVRALYCQIIGRGTRPFKGKSHLLVLDFLWHSDKHDLCRPAHLVAPSEDVAKKMIEIAEDGSKKGVQLEFDLIDLEEEGTKDATKEREEKLARELKEKTKLRRSLIDPIAFSMSIDADDLKNYIPKTSAEMAPASVKQVELLEKLGINPEKINCAGFASKLIGRIEARKVNGYSTPKQIKMLNSFGFKNTLDWTFQDAQKMINRIAAAQWNAPNGVDPKTYIPPSLTVGEGIEWGGKY
jgi:superfamily II DNA or RNA helicase